MVASRASRLVAEIVGEDVTRASVGRQDVTIAAEQTTANTQRARSSRIVVEVVGDEPPVCSMSREDVMIAGQQTTANNQRALATRLVAEIVGAEEKIAAIDRLDVTIAGQQTAANNQRARVTRIVVEVVAPQGSAGPISPLALGDDTHIFLHNWVSRCEMRTSYLTDVQASPDTGAESRLGLSLKPFRSMKLEWLNNDIVKLERLEVLLRRMTDAPFQVPLYMDQRELSAYNSGDFTIDLQTNRGRFFPGGRVVIVQFDGRNEVESFSLHIIDTMTNKSLSFAAPQGVDVKAGSFVMPMMDCEVILEVESEYITARVSRVTMTVSEIPGASQLPPLKSDNPSDVPVFQNKPVFIIEPDWVQSVTKGRDRQGSRSRNGRADIITTEGDRSRQTHAFLLTGDRDDMWPSIEFFDTRRGRLRTFWLIDQDQYLIPQELDATGNFVSVSETVDLADFSEEFDYVGVVMNDGTVYVREVVTIQQVLTVFRLTVTPPLPMNLSVANVARIARARVTRFLSDELSESWTTTGHMTTRLAFIEALNEADFPTT